MSVAEGFQPVAVTAGAPMWDPRIGHTLRFFNGMFWVMGGSSAEGVAYADAWSTLNGYSWQEFQVPWPPRTAHISFVLDVSADVLLPSS